MPLVIKITFFAVLAAAFLTALRNVWASVRAQADERNLGRDFKEAEKEYLEKYSVRALFGKKTGEVETDAEVADDGELSDVPESRNRYY